MQPPEIGESLKVFHLEEAGDLLPLVKKVTAISYQQLGPVQDRLNRMLANDPRRAQHEQAYQLIVSNWKKTIERLGVTTTGLWMVDFDLGNGCLAWRYPELSLAYFREHGKSFEERIKLADYIEENDPDWAH